MQRVYELNARVVNRGSFRRMSHQDLLLFLDASPSPWHAVGETVRLLEAAGYRHLDEREEWKVGYGDRVLVTRGGSSLAALEIGTEPTYRAGFRLVGAHTDSPNFRIKPHPDRIKAGQHQLGVEVYGGVLLYTWLDRDLGLAGRVWLRGESEPRKVQLDRALLRIPSLAIHLDRQVNTEGLLLNPQNHIPPVLALESGGAIRLSELLIEAVRKDGESHESSDLLSYELCTYDITKAALGGARSEYIFSARLDNLASCHASLTALLQPRERTEASRGIFFFDHEECGSQSLKGAESPLLRDLLQRITRALGEPDDALSRAVASSYFVSADMAHAVHPNFADRHDPEHAPHLGAGPVIKWNVNQRYATDGETAAMFERCCRDVEIAPQRFVTRTDLPCGSTIGPITAAQLGIRTVDVGNPMLSMHSCREMGGTADVAKMEAALGAFFAS